MQPDALWGAGNLGVCIPQTLVWLPGQGDLETGAKAPGDHARTPGSWACPRPFQFLSQRVTPKAGGGVGGNGALCVMEAGWGAGLRVSPQATPVRGRGPPRHLAESWAWPPSPCSVSHGQGAGEAGGVRGARWALCVGKPSFESTFFSKPQARAQS